MFGYHVAVKQNPPTKCLVLSTIARLYDPVSTLGPVVFWAKLLMQDVAVGYSVIATASFTTVHASFLVTGFFSCHWYTTPPAKVTDEQSFNRLSTVKRTATFYYLLRA